MSGFLLDTSIVSVLAPSRREPSGQLLAWLDARTDRLHLSTVTMAEIEKGICKLRRGGASTRADEFSRWRDEIVLTYGRRLLPLTANVAKELGRMWDAADAIGRNPGVADLAIAATARHHGLAVATRNVRHFEPLGDVVDPVAEAPRS